MARRSTITNAAVAAAAGGTATLSDFIKPEDETTVTDAAPAAATIPGGALGIVPGDNGAAMAKILAQQPRREPLPGEIPDVKSYVVENHEGVHVMVNGVKAHLKHGKIVDSQNYDIKRLELMGVQLKQVGV